MIECSVREKGKRPGFQMDHCITAMEASADVKACLLYTSDRFPDPDHRKRAERWSDLSGRSGRAGASFGNPFHIDVYKRQP